MKIRSRKTIRVTTVLLFVLLFEWNQVACKPAPTKKGTGGKKIKKPTTTPTPIDSENFSTTEFSDIDSESATIQPHSTGSTTTSVFNDPNWMSEDLKSSTTPVPDETQNAGVSENPPNVQGRSLGDELPIESATGPTLSEDETALPGEEPGPTNPNGTSDTAGSSESYGRKRNKVMPSGRSLGDDPSTAIEPKSSESEESSVPTNPNDISSQEEEMTTIKSEPQSAINNKPSIIKMPKNQKKTVNPKKGKVVKKKKKVPPTKKGKNQNAKKGKG